MNWHVQMVAGLALALACTAAWAAEPAGQARPIVGAVRWDAWYGRGGPVAEVERSLGPKKFHFRLPFFAQVLGDDKVSINGNSQETIDKEIALAAGAGLNYWTFVDYWDDPLLTIARRRYQAAKDKRGLRFCFIEEGGRLDSHGPEGWARLVTFFREGDYQKVLDGCLGPATFGPLNWSSDFRPVHIPNTPGGFNGKLSLGNLWPPRN
jgi:hypothetical protein